MSTSRETPCIATDVPKEFAAAISKDAPQRCNHLPHDRVSYSKRLETESAVFWEYQISENTHFYSSRIRLSTNTGMGKS